MSSMRLMRLRLAQAQMRQNSDKQDFAKKVEHHQMATDTLKGAIAAGVREHVALTESLERLRLSKVIEALRRVNSKEDFNAALGDLVCRLRDISDLAPVIAGVTMRNMRCLAVNEFIEALQALSTVWQKFDDAKIELLSLHQKLKQTREKLQDLDEKLRLLVIQDKIASAI